MRFPSNSTQSLALFRHSPHQMPFTCCCAIDCACVVVQYTWLRLMRAPQVKQYIGAGSKVSVPLLHTEHAVTDALGAPFFFGCSVASRGGRPCAPPRP